jgi:hypothetical protein
LGLGHSLGVFMCDTLRCTASQRASVAVHLGLNESVKVLLTKIIGVSYE